MLRAREQIVDVGLLDHPAGVHHDDPVGVLRDDAQVVRDEQDGRAGFLQLAHQLEDLRLDGHVEGGRRLVGDQHLRVAGQRHRDHDALPHAARTDADTVARCSGPGCRHASSISTACSMASRLRHALMHGERLDDLVARRCRPD